MAEDDHPSNLFHPKMRVEDDWNANYITLINEEKEKTSTSQKSIMLNFIQN